MELQVRSLSYTVQSMNQIMPDTLVEAVVLISGEGSCMSAKKTSFISEAY